MRARFHAVAFATVLAGAMMLTAVFAGALPSSADAATVALHRFAACSPRTTWTCVTASEQVAVFSGSGPYMLQDRRVSSNGNTTSTTLYRLATATSPATGDRRGTWVTVPLLREGSYPLTHVSDTITILDSGGHPALMRDHGRLRPATFTTTSRYTAPTVTVAPISPAAGATAVTAAFTTNGEVNATVCTLDKTFVFCAGDAASLGALAVGAHIFTVTVYGPGGHNTASASFTVAPAPPPPPPTVEVTGLPATSDATSGNATYATGGAVSAVTCTLDDVATPCANGSARLTALTLGSHTFAVAVAGPGGDDSASASFTVTPVLPASSGPLGVPGNWNLIFDDEFTAPALNTALWSTGWFHPNGISGPINTNLEPGCYDPSFVGTPGGELDLSLVTNPETCETPGGPVTYPYAGSIVTTNGNFSFTYGYLEARVWLPGNGEIADWPSVWADGADWPADGELDVLEGLGGQACYHFHYGASYATEQGPGGCVGTDYTGGWHTFAADWEPGQVTWYYDGVAVGSLNEGITDSPMYLILNLALLPPAWGAPVLSPATMRVAYVRVWQHP